MRPIKVCFVSLYSYALFNTKSDLIFGGSEVRAGLLSKGVAADPRFDVSVVVRQHDNRRLEHIGKIKIWRHPGYRTTPTPGAQFRAALSAMVGRKRTFPFFKIRKFNLQNLARCVARFGPSLASRLRHFVQTHTYRPILIDDERIHPNRLAIYKDVDADIYCAFGANEVSAEVAKYCALFGKKLLLLCGSDYDLLPSYVPGSKERTLYSCRKGFCYYALAGAHQIVAQTQLQVDLLRQRFGRHAELLRNPIELSGPIPPLRDRRFALWIGKSDNVKRPELALELARRQPDVKMVMVMNRSLDDKFHAIIAAKPPNVTIIERVPIDKIERLFARAFVLVNTSDFEGFPNTFLQAGKYAVPILSLHVDPDGFIQEHGCGIVAKGDMECLSAGLARFANNLPDREQFGARARSYVEKHHDLGKIVQKLIDVIDSRVAEPAGAQPECSLQSRRRAS